MIKRFDIIANQGLSSVIDAIEISLVNTKICEFIKRIEISITDDVNYYSNENKEIAEKGFVACLIRKEAFGNANISIIVNTKNCTRANLNEREIASVIYHELGHILNEPELPQEPTFEFCFIHGIKFNKQVLDEVRISNGKAMEEFADSFATKYGFGSELISTFHKQNQHFEQKIGFFEERIEKILNNEILEGNIMSLHNGPR